MSLFNGGASGLLRPITDGETVWAGDMMAGEEPWRTLGYSARQLTAYLRRHDPALARLAILSRGRSVGVFCLRYPWLRGPFVELIGLAPESRGKGLGRQAIEWAWSRRPDNLWVSVTEFNMTAQAFYAGLGFLEVARLPGLVKPEFTEILLRKTK